MTRFIGLSEALFLMASGAFVIGTAYLFELVINGLLPTLFGF